MFRLVLVGCLVGVSLGFTAPRAARAQADGWSATFGERALSAYFSRAERLLVVAAGGEAAEPARAALAQGLQRLGVALVMDGAALGDVSNLDDQAIIAKARPFPVDAVAVVRVFSSDGGPAAVVVVAYDKRGDVKRALNGRAGEPLPAPPVEAGGAGQGVSQAAAEAVSQVAQAAGQGHEQRVEEYKDRYLHFGEGLLLSGSPEGIVVSKRLVPQQGRYQRKLSWVEFFEIAERPDLASRYRNRRLARVLLMVAGPSAMLAGGLMLWNAQPDYEVPYNPALEAGGAAVLLLGGATLLTGLFLRKLPVKAHEARRLAARHNRRLRARLQLGDDLQPLRGARVQRGLWERLRLTPALGMTQARLSLSLELR